MPEMPDWKSLVEERLRTLRCETPAEPDLTAELAQHLEDYYRELCSGGASEEEAYQRTLSELDDVYPLRAEVERSNRMAKYDAVPAGDARPGNLFEDFCRDLGYGGRAIRKSPLFTLAAVLCLGMGIGANTTVFTIINTLLLHPLPASDPSRLVVLYDAQASRRTQQWSQPGLAYANLQDYMAGQKCFRSVAAFTWPQVLTLAGTNGPERMFGELVSGQYFDTLGLTPALGRFFLPSEAREPGSAPVAVMSYGAWQARYGGARDILGRTLELNNIAFKVIGVAPKDFLGVSAVFGPDVWLPATISERLSPAGLLPTIQREVRATDSNIEMSDARTGAMLLDQVLWGPKVGVALLGVFGSLALVLASVGLYGVMAYSVSRRRPSAEDALSEALVAALKTWPRDDVPQNPEAWLLTAARHSLVDVVRHHQVVLESEPILQFLRESSTEAAVSTTFQDERLKLLFVRAHPAIDPAMHTPLMLQTVLGLDAARIAQAFLIAPKTMGQRLSRAKTKIRRGGIQFEIPQERDLPERLETVLEAIYAAFGVGWDDMVGADQRGRDLTEEAIWLARVLLQLMPGEAESQGLLALMLHCEARRPARRGPDGRCVPLSEQDPKQWSLPLMEEAERHLAEAFERGHPGRFQLEAAIQSVHAERARTGRSDWAAIALFYEKLIRISPALGTRVGYAAAVAEASGPETGISVLDAIEPEGVSNYQPYWAVRAHLLQRLGKTREASDAYDGAIGLAEYPAVREFLIQKRG